MLLCFYFLKAIFLFHQEPWLKVFKCLEEGAQRINLDTFADPLTLTLWFRVICLSNYRMDCHVDISLCLVLLTFQTNDFPVRLSTAGASEQVVACTRCELRTELISNRLNVSTLA